LYCYSVCEFICIYSGFLNTNRNIFGGYTPINWNRERDFSIHPKKGVFLFSLVNPWGIAPFQCMYTMDDHAGSTNSQEGIRFGNYAFGLKGEGELEINFGTPHTYDMRGHYQPNRQWSLG
jgi:hypothetical protein